MENETNTETPASPPKRRKGIIASLKGLGFTIVVLAALWIAMRYVLTPLVLPKEAPPEQVASAPAYEERLKILEDKVAALENAKPAETPEITPLEERLTALEARPAQAPVVSGASSESVDALRADVEKMRTENKATIRSILLVGRLQDAIQNGAPFNNELAALRGLRPDLKETLDALEPLSIAGVATLAQLQSQFARSIDPVLTPKEDTESFTGNLRSLVKIRKVGENQKGTDDQAIIARAEAKLANGYVAMAIGETENLSPAAAKNFEAWQKRANDYLLADAAGQRLEADIAKGAE
jgi:hypothetical protein